MPRLCEFRDLGRMRFAPAWDLQKELVERRKRGVIADQFLLVEHERVITMGRNGKMQHVLASPEILERTGIEFFHIDRGGDATYHGPGQIVGYPIIDLREWKRDVVAYVRALEQVLMDALAEFDLAGERVAGATGVWIGGKKIAAIGVHISRWVTSHGFALNVDTDLKDFQYIVPCGLTAPVTSFRDLGLRTSRAEVAAAIERAWVRNFQYDELAGAGSLALAGQSYS